jgi:predicted metalloprotease
MDLSGQRESDNVVDKRGAGGMIAAGGGVGTVILGLVLYFVFGVNPQNVIPPAQQRQAAGPVDPNDPQVKFVKKVLGSTEDVWRKQFANVKARYRDPKLELFSGQVRSACGLADSAVGPFYCPGDQMVYLDLSFFRDMDRQLHAGGDFARAYVIAHEIGHHVQHLLGYAEREEAAMRREGKNRASVRLELQADYLAGVWAHYAQRDLHLDRKDLESALNAAHQIGDDTLQKRGRGHVMPDSFTHGTSQQRVNAFRSGFDSGKFDREALDYFFTTPYDRLEK